MSYRQLSVIPVPGPGAEDVLLDEEGAVYTGTADGQLIRVSPDRSHAERFAHTGGRPLGLEWLPDGRLLVCDAHRGLLAADPATGEVETLVLRVGGREMVFCNNAAVAADGTVYFSDSSQHYSIEDWRSDMIDDTQSGRLMRRRVDGRIDVLLDGLSFANGVALSAGEDYVAVAETTARRVTRLWLSGPLAGEKDRLADDLPCYPDNIARGTDGLIWVTYASPHESILDLVHRTPKAVRAIVRGMPEVLKPRPKRTVRVAAYDDSGTKLHDIALDASAWHMATGVREHHGQVWLGSLLEPAVACFTL